MLFIEEFFGGKAKPRQEFNENRIVNLRPKNIKSEPKINPKLLLLTSFTQELNNIKI